jgi:putative glutamine amidotransferase
VEDKKPLLGICRGCQVLNVAYGGTLYQDLPAQWPESGHKIGSWNDLCHSVSLNTASRLAHLLGASELPVNSLHHQAIKDAGAKLTVVGKTKEGIIEAVEDPAHPFLVAVQWHPEGLWQEGDRIWLKLFEGLVEAARRFEP